MKFTSTIISSVFVVAVAAVPLQQRAALVQKRLVDASLVPSFGVTPGIKDPAGSASCVGINNILIPCTCPPDSTTFINVRGKSFLFKKNSGLAFIVACRRFPRMLQLATT
ncbi:hypothetical protein DFH07DRAFT_809244 [Mycena maculata]|uniref:Hydrophobin n=1 Tax=Mycena maculata TaxID=230809 RepID=A0AAD7NL86_9AGAR|nr:hypothetical protein DFH07DRAFT_809244 [Mycena maculata]